MMNICFLTHNLQLDNGAGVFSRRLIVELSRALGAEAVALTVVPSGEPYERPLLSGGKIRIARSILKIRAEIKKCDAVHALDVFPCGIVAAVACLGLGKKVVITAIGSGSILPLYHWVYAPLARWVYRQAYAITAISTFTRDEILKKMPNLKIVVINPGVDANNFRRTDQTAYDMTRFKPYILSVGALRWRKGYKYSIPAFAKVKRQFPDLQYIIVGKRLIGTYYHRIHTFIQNLGLEESVHILEDVDTREQLADVYGGAELFCLFSQNANHDVEGFGLVFLEAAAAGLPVVGSKNCGIDDAVRDGENGILVPTRNPEDFADAVIRILSDEALKKRMSAASYALARESAWESRTREYVTVYARVMGVISSKQRK